MRKPPLTSSESLRQTLGWTTLEMRRRNALLCQVHRCFTNQAPSYLCSKFTSNSSLHYAETRGSTKLHLPHPRTKFYHSSFEFHGAKIFNSLPTRIRELKDRKQFRHAVQNTACSLHYANCIKIVSISTFPLNNFNTTLLNLGNRCLLLISTFFVLCFLFFFQDLYENLQCTVGTALLLKNKIYLSIYQVH